MDKEIENLMRCVQMINDASDETINLIKENPMSNLKLIDRSSKCLKDPNPLATTMSLMSTKFPLSVDREKALKAGIPKMYLYDKSQMVEDTHYHGRVLCKKEAVEWWINKSEIPKQDTIDVMNILMKQHRTDVQTYYNIDWRGVRIQWGTPNLERRRVATRKPSIEIDSSIRENALMQALLPLYTVPHIRVTPTDLNKISDLINTSITSKMALSSQIRILLNQMDPRRRVLPVLPGSPDNIMPLKHALVHSNFIITNYMTDELRKTSSPEILIDKFGKCLHYEYVGSSMDTTAARKVIHKTKVMEKPLLNYLMDRDLPETNYIKWMKVIMGQKITSESESHGLRTSPVPAKVYIKHESNEMGTRFFLYEGQETVNFKFGDMRGSFKHSGETILNVTTNYTTFMELRRLLAEIAVYCRWGFRGTTCRSYEAMKQIVRDQVIRDPHQPISSTPCELEALTNSNEPGKAGALEIVKSSEYRVCTMDEPYIDAKGNIKSTNTNQTIVLPKAKNQPPPIPHEVHCNHPLMMDHLDFKRMIKNKVSFYIENQKTLRDHIAEGEFGWGNKAVTRFLGNIAASLSKTCRDLLMGMNDQHWVAELAAFYYCFAHTSPLGLLGNQYKFVVGQYIVDLESRSGILRYIQDKGEYLLFGVKLVKTPEIDYQSQFRTFLDGYRLEIGHQPSMRIMPIKTLEDKKMEFKSGETFNTFISGQAFTAIRDPSIEYSRTQTIARQINAKSLWIAELSGIGRKRFVGEVDIENEATTSKRLKSENNGTSDDPGIDWNVMMDDGDDWEF